MKRTALMTLLLALAVIAVGLSACQPTATPDTNRNGAVANTNAANETIDTAAIEAELTRIEKDFPRVLKEQDAQAVDRVEADDIVIIYPDGEVGSKSLDVNDIKTGALSADLWEVTDVKVKVLDKDAAFVTGRSIVTGGKAKTLDGKTIDVSGQYRFIDTFARRNGEWKLVASISTPVKRPPVAAPASPSPKSSPKAAVSPIGKPSNATTKPTP